MNTISLRSWVGNWALRFAIPPLFFAVLGLALGCKKNIEVAGPSEGWCAFPVSRGNTAEGLRSPAFLKKLATSGLLDLNAGYNGFIAPVKNGEKILVRGEFPHARYVSFTIYDQDFMFVDKLSDRDLVPVSGKNPFLPGVDRSGKTGEFELTILMDRPPSGPRPANTLYAGVNHQGGTNKLLIFVYRVYLADRGLGYRDGNAMAAYGGVNPPCFQIMASDGHSYCPDPQKLRAQVARTELSIISANLGTILNPRKAFGKPESPPIWLNNASTETKRESTFVLNDDTAYLVLPVSAQFGDLLVLRWNPPRTPQETYTGQPFPPDYDLRYWSITFAYLDHSRPLLVYTESTVADIDVPTLPDGTRQLVIGLGGIARPASVPAAQWHSFKHKQGYLFMRNIMIQPDYPGNFFKLPPGKISMAYDKYTPGGVYCSAAEFAKNPDLGLTRGKLLKLKAGQ